MSIQKLGEEQAFEVQMKTHLLQTMAKDGVIDPKLLEDLIDTAAKYPDYEPMHQLLLEFKEVLQRYKNASA